MDYKSLGAILPCRLPLEDRFLGHPFGTTDSRGCSRWLAVDGNHVAWGLDPDAHRLVVERPDGFVFDGIGVMNAFFDAEETECDRPGGLEWVSLVIVEVSTHSVIGETTFGIALDVRRDLLDNVVDDENEALDDAATEVVGLGLDLDFDGDDLRGDTLIVFDDEDAAADADVGSLLGESDQTALADTDVTTDGRVTTITSRVDAEALWEAYWPGVELGTDEE